MKRLSLLTGAVAAFALLGAGGCGDEPSSVAKVPTFKKGGNIRFINLSAEALDGYVDDQQACQRLGFGKMAGPRLTALGEHELRASAGGQTWSEKLRLESEQTVTVYAYGSKPEFVAIAGDPITPPAGETLIRATNLGGGDTATFSMKSAGNEKALGAIGHGEGGEHASVSPGSYTFTAKIGDKVVATAEANVQADQTHTVLLTQEGGKTVLLVIHNNPLMIPTQSGASGA